MNYNFVNSNALKIDTLIPRILDLTPTSSNINFNARDSCIYLININSTNFQPTQNNPIKITNVQLNIPITIKNNSDLDMPVMINNKLYAVFRRSSIKI